MDTNGTDPGDRCTCPMSLRERGEHSATCGFVTNRSDLYESGYDLPGYLTAPGCPACGRLYCYCLARYTPAASEVRHG